MVTFRISHPIRNKKPPNNKGALLLDGFLLWLVYHGRIRFNAYAALLPLRLTLYNALMPRFSHHALHSTALATNLNTPGNDSLFSRRAGMRRQNCALDIVKPIDVFPHPQSKDVCISVACYDALLAPASIKGILVLPNEVPGLTLRDGDGRNPPQKLVLRLQSTAMQALRAVARVQLLLRVRHTLTHH